MRICLRSQSGSMMALAFAALLPLMGAIGGFAVDCMHVNDERGALQRATDAGALAGANAIAQWTAAGPQNDTNTSSSQIPLQYALTVASLNWVDGRQPVTGGSTSVTAEMINDQPGGATQPQPYALNTALESPSQTPNACHVFASMQIRSLFAGFFGNWMQNVSTSSVAAMPNNGTFPLILSAPTAGLSGYGGALAAGSTITVTEHSNAAWTIDKPTPPISDPNIANALTAWLSNPQQSEIGLGYENAVLSGSSVATQWGNTSNYGTAVPVGTIAVVPITTAASLNGAGPFTIAGFISIKVTAAGTAGTFTGTILPLSGTGFISPTPYPPQNYLAKLIQ